MIQRKQTLFLLLAVILAVVTLSLPIADLTAGGWKSGQLYCLMLADANGSYHYAVWPLFVLLLAAAAISTVAIFLYKRRPLQARLCLLAMVVYLLWYLVLAFFSKQLAPDAADFHLSVTTLLPLASAVLCFMARRGILADERLVRAADRLR